MRTAYAVVAGLAVTGLMILCGDWIVGRLTDTTVVPGYPGASRQTVILTLLWTSLSLIVGAVLAVRIKPTRETVAGFVVGELFFGAGLLHQFWHAQTWFNFLALLIVIPAALLGTWLASHGKPGAISWG